MDRRAAPLLAVVALSCSLIVPLDYSGGKEPSNVHGAGSGGIGTAAVGGTIFDNEGGTMSEGGSDAGGAPEGGTGGSGDEGGSGGDSGNAAMGGTGETAGVGVGGTLGGGMSGVGGAGGGSGADGGSGAGGVSGTGGDGGSGATTGGDGGQGGGGAGGRASGGASGRGGRGGRGGGGMGGNAAGAAGSAGCVADLQNDEAHCGTCTTVCDGGEECVKGVCAASPCDGLCSGWTVAANNGSGFRIEPVDTADHCYEIPAYVPDPGHDARIVCWNFDDRQLFVNDIATECKVEPGVKLTMMEERKGGYCVRAGTDSTRADSGFLLPE